MTNDVRGNGIIDSREIIARLEELQETLDELGAEVTEAEEQLEEARGQVDEEVTEDDGVQKPTLDFLNESQERFDLAEKALRDWKVSDEGEEYQVLSECNEDGETIDDWSHGVTLIHENEFEKYARELAEDIGDVSANPGWPHSCIDWVQAANELKMDYSSIEFDGNSYYAR
jgi:hypothetical protein